MKVSRRFQLAIHIVLFIAYYGEKQVITCETISQEMKCNIVIIKNILNILCKNNIIKKDSYILGIKLKKDKKDITLWDIYKITYDVNVKNLFCSDDLQIENPVVEDLSELLIPTFDEIIESIKNTLSLVSIDSLLKDLNLD